MRHRSQFLGRNMTRLIAFLGFSFQLLAEPRTDEPIQPILPVVVKNAKEVELGKMLFFEPRLSKSGLISCNSCHNLAAGGSDNLVSSVGHKWHLGPINAPTVLNSNYSLAQFWDGRAKDLADQAGGPIQAEGEMASSHALAVKTIASIDGYKKHFKAAYGTEKVSIEAIRTAIAKFEETLVTPDSRFDQWLAGDDKALSKAELSGYEHFKNFGCVGCHNGAAVGGGSFQKFGLVNPYTKDTKTMGRFGVTKVETDKYMFKVPTLRNIELTYPYFHDGSVWTLEEAVDVMAWHQLGRKLQKNETTELVAFLKTLTGKQPEITLPALPPSGPRTPRPDVGDPMLVTGPAEGKKTL